MPELLEIVMLLCFGASWPINAVKSYKARTARGKSIFFLLLIELGYIAGISAKLLNPTFDYAAKWYVLFFYVLNFLMVGVDVAIYFRNRKLDKLAAANA
ncbi:MAG: hypothetical protein E7450_07655 [Ruminococcaceae bacterium]|nr:hypothetical protein [Oscillospiraceae bacterium]